MATRRKDHKGRVLNAGESQRKNLTYQYRYTDANGERKTVYAKDLTALRAKEEDIQKASDRGTNYAEGNATVLETLRNYTRKRADDTRYTTQVNMGFVLQAAAKYPLASMAIRNVRVSHAKDFCRQMVKSGYSFWSVKRVKCNLHKSFQAAVDDGILLRNPFDFKLDFLLVKPGKRTAMTTAEQQKMLQFLHEKYEGTEYLDLFVILLGTGLRVSELAGLTFKDIDFQNRTIHVERQLMRKEGFQLYCEPPKTEAGYRFVSISSDVADSLHNVISRRGILPVEPLVDGHSGFLFINKNGNPKVALHFEQELQRMVKAYNRSHEEPMRPISPHVLRHTFCTNMINMGMKPKNVQYLMGHSSVTITLDIYTDFSPSEAHEEMLSLLG